MGREPELAKGKKGQTCPSSALGKEKRIPPGKNEVALKGEGKMYSLINAGAGKKKKSGFDGKKLWIQALHISRKRGKKKMALSLYGEKTLFRGKKPPAQRNLKTKTETSSRNQGREKGKEKKRKKQSPFSSTLPNGKNSIERGSDQVTWVAEAADRQSQAQNPLSIKTAHKDG